jgi:hypothetical protein
VSRSWEAPGAIWVCLRSSRFYGSGQLIAPLVPSNVRMWYRRRALGKPSPRPAEARGLRQALREKELAALGVDAPSILAGPSV